MEAPRSVKRLSIHRRTRHKGKPADRHVGNGQSMRGLGGWFRARLPRGRAEQIRLGIFVACVLALCVSLGFGLLPLRTGLNPQWPGQFEPLPARYSPGWWITPIEPSTALRPSVTSNSLDKIVASSDGRRLWAVGPAGTILKSTDGGESWARKDSGTQQGLWGVAVSSDGRTLWAVGSFGTILKSTDSGESWALKSSGTKADLVGVAASSGEQTLWTVGGTPDNSRTILKSTDGGENWALKSYGTQQVLFGVAVSSDGHTLWAVPAPGLIGSGRA